MRGNHSIEWLIAAKRAEPSERSWGGDTRKISGAEVLIRVPGEVVMKPKVFVGSSTKGLQIAELVQSELEYEAEAVLWSQGVFRKINVPIEDLMTAVESFDFAVFVLHPEDRIDVRGEEALAIRDNVIFELGLFLGKLGRSRNFFIAPALPGEIKSRLPSDLSGITPAQYDPTAKHLQASVGASLLQLKQAIRNLTARFSSKTVLYETGQRVRPYDFAAREGCFWKNEKPVSERGTGVIEYLQEGVLKLTRTNQEGRFEIELRQDGPDSPSIRKSQSPPRRILRVAFDAKVDAGEHSVRFVLKDIELGKWAADQKRTIGNTDWQPIELYFVVSPAVDLLFRIDDEKPTVTPSTLYMRHLVIEDAA